jgi:mRNA interferase MazF
MATFSKNEIVLVRYPFSDLSTTKVRPAVVFTRLGKSPDYVIVPLTSKSGRLSAGEFILADWQSAGLNLPSAVKQGLYTIHSSLILRSVGRLSAEDARQIEQSVRQWLDLP